MTLGSCLTGSCQRFLNIVCLTWLWESSLWAYACVPGVSLGWSISKNQRSLCFSEWQGREQRGQRIIQWLLNCPVTDNCTGQFHFPLWHFTGNIVKIKVNVNRTIGYIQLLKEAMEIHLKYWFFFWKDFSNWNSGIFYFLRYCNSWPSKGAPEKLMHCF